ncbi:uncharacterized protein PHACADRAFT_31623 [Phanerochaete carnosa HHB-10118-sp]|uniref:CSC1/OSCA1-like 7TM region domain-containing protein n=1 Tax=Phanerochaete carnosa (strain HHB-10118-sp) TaxID=650164 RepID=K5UPV4_PHACS|nr:uncharacterized protein PHACADRAFT_31623 [Phanerochaete carnosa HHB-10118-sp]EKM51821.1 hypothetical protein PHACADRAFT_31623 [Phanerochaete carnosa HHB-10118-sp]
MVTDIPTGLRSEKELKEYFEYYMSRSIPKPSTGMTSSAQPGYLDRSAAFIFNKGVQLISRVFEVRTRSSTNDTTDTEVDTKQASHDAPVIERVILVRNMTELATLLGRREEVLRYLETAHIKLARNALEAVDEIVNAPKPTVIRSVASRVSFGLISRGSPTGSLDVERATDREVETEDRMRLLVRTLSPYLPEHKPRPSIAQCLRSLFFPHPTTNPDPSVGEPQKSGRQPERKTVWEALLSLPRSTLDTYQPLIHLSALFRGKTVPAIDYYTAKLNLLTGLITEERSLPPHEFTPMSTAFVTFADPVDARRASKYLAVHPNNPVSVCLASMAPSYEDLDWTRLMKSTYYMEFVKDWVVDLGVWGFTIFWVFPVSSIVGLVSIQNIGAFWPALKNYLDVHEWQSEVLESLVPTVLVALLSLLIPLLLLLIAKKAQTIVTLSALHDRIMARYYKFLIVNVLVFFCVGTTALQSFLVSFQSVAGNQLIQGLSMLAGVSGSYQALNWSLIRIVVIFNMGIHGGLEIALFGLPLLLYPSTKHQVTPRKRAVGIRPRTYNFYYWLPNHLLVIHVLLLFAVLNPLVLPFGLLYFCVEAVVVKNQLLHVYAKNYEGNGQTLLIRLIRYSLDGLTLAQSAFLAYMAVLKQKANVGVSAVLIILTVFMKIILTRFCRAKFERDDLLEAQIMRGSSALDDSPPLPEYPNEEAKGEKGKLPEGRSRIQHWTWKLSNRVGMSYRTIIHRQHNHQRPSNPFTHPYAESTIPTEPCSSTAELLTKINTTASTAMVTGEPLQESPTEEDPRPFQGDTRSTLVVSHPPHPVWDDDSSPDIPYDNPYYTRPISNTLWLPRDPLGILHLDDTIDLRMALTSESSGGKLGGWHEDEFLCSAISSAFVTSFGSVDGEFESIQLPQHAEDGEVLEPPPSGTSRTGTVERPRTADDGARKPSLPPPRRPSHASELGDQASNSDFQRTSPLRERQSSTGFRSFSLGVDAPAARPVPSHLPISDTMHWRQRSSSVDTPSMDPLSTSRSQFSAGSQGLRSIIRSQTIVVPNSATSQADQSMISTREVVVSEAIAEEQIAAQRRQRQEAADEVKAKEPRSWLTSWLYAKG